jgi:hypothetical protein
MKTNDELMQPRYKVIADYPASDYKVGLIISDIGPNFCEYLERYPHLFKKLEWWQDLKPIDFPKYVKWKFGGVFRVINWRTNLNTSELDGVYTTEGFLFIKDSLPATEQEYNESLGVVVKGSKI